MDEMKNYHTEICAYCKKEVSVVWDTEHDGYDIYCPACGKKLRLCSACEKYKAALCDYNEDTGECSMTEEKNNG